MTYNQSTNTLTLAVAPPQADLDGERAKFLKHGLKSLAGAPAGIQAARRELDAINDCGPAPNRHGATAADVERRRGQLAAKLESLSASLAESIASVSSSYVDERRRELDQEIDSVTATLVESANHLAALQHLRRSLPSAAWESALIKIITNAN